MFVAKLLRILPRLTIISSLSYALHAQAGNSVQLARELKELLKESLPLAEQQILTLPEATYLVGPDPALCTAAAVANMSTYDQWTICPGIAEYFFSDAGYFPSTKPRPTSLEFNKVKSVEARFGEPRVRCQQNNCKLSLPIKKLVFSSGLKAMQINASYSYAAGNPIFNFKKTAITLSPNFLGQYPTLRARISLGEDGKVNFFDENRSSIKLPVAAVKVAISDGFADRPLADIFEHSGIVKINQMILNSIVGTFAMFSTDIKTIHYLVDFNSSLNDHFRDAAKVKTLSELLNRLAVPPIIQTLNNAVGKDVWEKVQTMLNERNKAASEELTATTNSSSSDSEDT